MSAGGFGAPAWSGAGPRLSKPVRSVDVRTKEPGMKKRTVAASVPALRAILLSLSLTAVLAACSTSPSPCETAGNCYQPPTTFYSGSYYLSRGGFVFGGGGKSR
jgi:hypothetical protein